MNETNRRPEQAGRRRKRMWAWTVLVIPPLLLHLPVLHYSLTTPFALIDDYNHLGMVIFDNSPLTPFLWFQNVFLSGGNERYRPFFEVYNELTWGLFGPKPWLHHLGRWMLHLGAVLMFAAAFRRFTFGGRRSLSSEVLPLATLTYLWMFFPNVPASRLFPQEVLTVFFLGLANWMAALMLTSGARYEPSGSWTRSARLQYGLFCLAVLGLSMSKEVNVAIVLWVAVVWCGVAFFTPLRSRSREIRAGLPLVVIFFLTLHMVYKAASVSGVGYGATLSRAAFIENVTSIRMGLFQVDTSFVITAWFAALAGVLLVSVAVRIAVRRIDRELIFVLFLLGQFTAAILVLGASWGVVLRYWYVLVPLLAMLLAFAVKIVIDAAGRSKLWTYAASLASAGFLVFFVGCNYYNFLFQTIVQHSLRGAEESVVSEVRRLVERGEFVRIRRTQSEYELFLHALFSDPVRSARHWGRILQAHQDKPETGRRYYYVTRDWTPDDAADAMTIRNRRDYRLLSYASKTAGVLQGRARPFRSRDAGVYPFDAYQWNIREAISLPSELLVDSYFDVHLDRETNSLRYLRSPCEESDYGAVFFLNVTPLDVADLSDDRKEDGFDNMDFGFHDHGFRTENHQGETRCIAERDLPSYGVAEIWTGQIGNSGVVWEERIKFEATQSPDSARSRP